MTMATFKLAWSALNKISSAVAGLVTNLFLFIFYYSVFALFALPFKLLSGPLSRKQKNSNWIIKESTPSTLKDFQNE